MRLPREVGLLLVAALGVGLASMPSQGEGQRGKSWKRDQLGWQELNRVVGSHMNHHAGVGLNMAEKIRIAQGAAGEAAAIKRTFKVSGSLVESARRDEFFALLDEGKVYVRSDTLYRSPAVKLATALGVLSDGELNSYALACGIPLSFFARKLPAYLRSIARRSKDTDGKSVPQRDSDKMDVERYRRQAVEQQVNALLRGPVHQRLAFLRLPALRQLLQRFGKVGCRYNRASSKVQMVRKLTHAKYREKPASMLYGDVATLLKRIQRARVKNRKFERGAAPLDDLPMPTTHNKRLHILEFAGYAVKTFGETIGMLCRMRVDTLYHALKRAGRAPGTGTAHGYVKGILDGSLLKDQWVVQIGAVKAMDVRKIDLVYGCLLLLFPEFMSCLADDNFVALIDAYMQPGDATVSHLAIRLRRHVCRKLDAEYLSTDGSNTWTARQNKPGQRGKRRQGLLPGAIVVGLREPGDMKWYASSYTARLHARLQGFLQDRLPPQHRHFWPGTKDSCIGDVCLVCHARMDGLIPWAAHTPSTTNTTTPNSTTSTVTAVPPFSFYTIGGSTKTAVQRKVWQSGMTMHRAKMSKRLSLHHPLHTVLRRTASSMQKKQHLSAMAKLMWQRNSDPESRNLHPATCICKKYGVTN